jgi:hypothetical protein
MRLRTRRCDCYSTLDDHQDMLAKGLSLLQNTIAVLKFARLCFSVHLCLAVLTRLNKKTKWSAT